jgi:uncharacterized membrane protein
MNLRSVVVAGTVGFAVMLIVGLWGIAQVGIDAQVPMHWNAAGEADGYGPAWLAFLLVPVISTLVILLLLAIPRFEPRRRNLQRSASAYRTVAVALIVLMTLVQLAVVLAGTGAVDFQMTSLISLGVGGLFIVMGNVLGTVRSNFLFGIRTPWTLSSDLAWSKTHRLVGRLFVVLGIMVIVLGVLGVTTAFVAVLVGGIVVILTVSFVYSYRVWKADPDKRDRQDTEASAV